MISPHFQFPFRHFPETPAVNEVGCYFTFAGINSDKGLRNACRFYWCAAQINYAMEFSHQGRTWEQINNVWVATDFTVSGTDAGILTNTRPPARRAVLHYGAGGGHFPAFGLWPWNAGSNLNDILPILDMEVDESGIYHVQMDLDDDRGGGPLLRFEKSGYTPVNNETEGTLNKPAWMLGLMLVAPPATYPTYEENPPDVFPVTATVTLSVDFHTFEAEA